MFAHDKNAMQHDVNSLANGIWTRVMGQIHKYRGVYCENNSRAENNIIWGYQHFPLSLKLKYCHHDYPRSPVAPVVVIPRNTNTMAASHSTIATITTFPASLGVNFKLSFFFSFFFFLRFCFCFLLFLFFHKFYD